MLRKTFTPHQRPTYQYLDSVNAALVRAFVQHGVQADDVTGLQARPWTFSCKGFAKAGGTMVLSALTVTTPDPMLTQALHAMQGTDIQAQPKTGDTVCLGTSRTKIQPWNLHPDQDEICVTFASPFLIARQPPYERSDPPFMSDIQKVDVAHLLKKAADKNAGRTLDINLAIDRLTLLTESTPRWMSFRQAGGRRIMLPGFRMPITLRGNPADIQFVLHAGLGAKTRQGFGCLTPML